MLIGSGLSYKTKQFFFVLIKLSIVAGAAYYVYHKLVFNEELKFPDFVDFLSKNDNFSTKSVLFLLFLTIFNWFLEIKKWQYLVSTIKYISFFEALKQSLASLTASLFTPNRIGDYAAKAVYFETKFRAKVLLLNLVSNMAQMCATLIFGCVGFLILITTYDLDVTYYKVVRIAFYAIVLIFFIGFGVSYKNLSIRGYTLNDIITFIKSVPRLTHIVNISLSFLRYIVFSFQLFYLLQLFNVQLSYGESMVIISSMYLLVSIIPTIFVLDIVVKGSVAIFLFDLAGVNNLVVLCVTTLMWLLNFVLPSVFGSYYILNFNSNSTFKTNPS